MTDESQLSFELVTESEESRAARAELITWIKQASYAELLRKWHHEDLSSPLFQGEVGDCFDQHLKQKRDELPEAEAQKIWDQSLK